MKKRITALVIVFALVLSFSVPVYATHDQIVDSIEIKENTVLIKGNTDVPYEDITVFIMKSGVDISELEGVTTEDEYLQKIAYVDFVRTDSIGRYELEAKFKVQDDVVHTVCVKNWTESYIDVLKKNDNVEKNYIDYIDYNDDEIFIKGMCDTEDSEISVVILNSSKTIEDYYDEGMSTVLDKKTVTVGSDNRFNVSFENILQENEKYNTYIIKNNVEVLSSIILQLPEKIYISNTKTGNNVFSNLDSANAYLETNLTDKPVDVLVDGGEYIIDKTIVFNEKRTVDTRIKYTADDEVVISGKKRIYTPFNKVTDEEILNKVYDNVKNNLVAVNLRDAGVAEKIIRFTERYDTGQISSLDIGFEIPMFFLNGEKLNLSRWPNSGFADINSVLYGGSTINQAKQDPAKITDGAEIILHNEDKLSRWSTAENMFIDGYFRYTWHGETIKVANVIKEDHKIKLKYASSYGVYTNVNNTYKTRFSVVNLLEEIDIPGEWYIDKEEGVMYLYAPYDLTEDDVLEVASLSDDIIRISGAENIILQGFNIEKNGISDTNALTYVDNKMNNGIEIDKSSSNIAIKDCTIRDVSSYGIVVSDHTVKNLWIDGCRVYNTGLSGIYIQGEDRITLNSSNMVVSNCDVSDVSVRVKDVNYAGIHIVASGAIVENNTIHNTISNGIRYRGSENIIRGNELFQNSYETADSGAIYTGRRWDSVGNVIEKNFIHHIGPKESIGKEVWLVYFDDGHAGNIMRSNILVGAERKDVRGVQIAQGPYNNVSSNTFVNFGEASVIDFSYRNGLKEAATTLANIPYSQIPYVNRYPYLQWLASLELEGENPNYAEYKENIVANNNITYNSGILIRDNEDSTWWQQYRDNVAMDKVTEGNVENIGNVFVNPSLMDYRVKTGEMVPEDILTEDNFEMSAFGKQKTMKEYREFSLTYPLNGDRYVPKEDVVLSWGKSHDADIYVYTIATDDDFNNVVITGETIYTNTEITGLDDDTIYYWKVEGKSLAGEGSSWECNTTFAFATYTTPVEANNPNYGTIKVTDENGNEEPFLQKGKKIIITDEVLSDTLATQPLVYVFAAYDENNNLEYYKTKSLTVVSNKKPVEVMRIILPEDIKNYKIFRWEGLCTLKPVN